MTSARIRVHVCKFAGGELIESDVLGTLLGDTQRIELDASYPVGTRLIIRYQGADSSMLTKRAQVAAWSPAKCVVALQGDVFGAASGGALVH